MNKSTNLRRYKIIDVFGNLKSISRPQEMMQYFVDIGFAMEELPEPNLGCYKGSRDFFNGGRIKFEPYKWDNEKLAEAYAPLIIAYKRIKSGHIMPPGYRSVA